MRHSLRSRKPLTKGVLLLYMNTPGLRMDEGHFMDEPDTPAQNPKPRMSKFHVSLGFTQLKDAELDDFATGIVTKMTANAALFPGQTDNVTAIDTAAQAYRLSLGVAKGGGIAATADKNAKRAVLEAALRMVALAIQGMPNLSPDDAAKSGYKIIEAGPHAPVAVERPIIEDVTNPAPTKLGIKVSARTATNPWNSRCGPTAASGSAPAHFRPPAASNWRNWSPERRMTSGSGPCLAATATASGASRSATPAPRSNPKGIESSSPVLPMQSATPYKRQIIHQP